MKAKDYIFIILIIVDVAFIIISQILLYPGENDSLSDRRFVGEFMKLSFETNFADGQKDIKCNGKNLKQIWMVFL